MQKDVILICRIRTFFLGWNLIGWLNIHMKLTLRIQLHYFQILACFLKQELNNGVSCFFFLGVGVCGGGMGHITKLNPEVLDHCHLDASSGGRQRGKHGDLVTQLSPESAAPEGIEPELEPRDSVGVDQRLAA